MRGISPRPFQFVLLRHGRNGTIEQTDFLDVAGDDPSRVPAESLIQACGRQGVIHAYNAGFERRVSGAAHPCPARGSADAGEMVPLVRFERTTY